MDRILLALMVVVIYGLLCLYFLRRRGAVDVQSAVPATASASGLPVLVAYASQSGTAEALARRSMQALAGHMPVRCLPLNQVDALVLAGTSRALFVASTYGEGEPPDNGARFARFYLSDQRMDLSHLQFAVLALGDRVYQEFCAFGHALHRGLCSHGATALSEPLEVSPEDVHRDDGVLPRWYAQLRQLGGADPAPQATGAPAYQSWQIESRQVVNPGSPGAPLVHVRLNPPGGAHVHWQAGDIAEILPRNSRQDCIDIAAALSLDPDMPVTVAAAPTTLVAELQRRQLPAKTSFSRHERGMGLLPLQSPETWLASLPELTRREYSIASIPQDGSLDLLVRQQRNEQGELGLASGWLTCHTAIGGDVELRVRSNPAFQAPPSGVPMILIGNGSGFAGLRAHLRARALRGDHQNWLLFGERSPVYDRLFETDISAWQEAGQLQRVDLAFSRCPSRPAYVQDLLLAAGDELHCWLQRGAWLYVCGSRKGLGVGLEAALVEVLGVDGLQQLKHSGRYRRDVY